MKKLILITMVLVPLLSFSQKDEWVLVCKSKTGNSELYLNAKNIIILGNTIKAWVKTKYYNEDVREVIAQMSKYDENPDKWTYLSYDLTFGEFDCNEYKSKTLTVNYFDTSDIFIHSSTYGENRAQWEYAVPNTVWHGLIESLKEYKNTKTLD
ncbi:MAG: hypothetical protein PHT07_24470 [Paludibacter sp.]|nr:hypothetical protein [Paludibacter sp.]